MNIGLKSYFLLLFSICFTSILNAQLNVTNYSSSDYSGASQNVSIEQASNGDLFFANSGEILIYSGLNNWKTKQLENQSYVRSIKSSNDKRIYIGGVGEIGELLIDDKGVYQYESLNEKIDTTYRNFSDVWTIKKHLNSICFLSKEALFQYDEGEMKEYTLQQTNAFKNYETKFHLMFSVAGRLFVRQAGLGLLELKPKGLDTVNNYSFWSNYNIREIFEEHDSFLVVTSSNGLFKTDKAFKNIYPQNNQLSKFLKETSVSKIEKLNSNTYSVLTFSNGIYIVNDKGELINKVDASNGLQGQFAYDQLYDGNGYLWLALSNGISMLSINESMSRFPKQKGLDGFVEDIELYNNEIYISGLSGITSTKDGKSFKHLDKLGTEFFQMEVVKFSEQDSSLLMASSGNVYELNRFGTSDAFGRCDPYSLHYMNGDLFVGQGDGLYKSKKVNGKWRPLEKIEGIDGTVFQLYSQSDKLLIGTLDKGAYIYNVITKETEHLGKESKTQSDLAYLYPLNDKVFVAAKNGLFQYDHGEVKDVEWYHSIYGNRSVHRIYEGLNNEIWIVSYTDDILETSIFYKEGDTYKEKKAPFAEYIDEPMHIVFPYQNTIWLGSSNGLLKYDESKSKDFDSPFRAKLVSVTLKNDSLINGQSGYQSSITELPFKQNSLVFNFSSTYYYKSEANTFSYILEGDENEWSDWKTKHSATYTNLYEGDYIFKVKSRNIYGKESIVSSYSFTVLPPWYRTWWAYALYTILGFTFIYIVIKINQTRLKLENRRLEGIVAERTSEIRQKKDEIEEQNKALEDKNEEIETQKQEIEDINRDIISSITYAKRIQESILPSDSLVEKLFPKSFILYKPKDIVSGDFYWVEETDEYDYFSAVDCTGHGVPGAFVSIVGRNGLDKTVKEFNKRLPNEMLDLLTDVVIDSFSKNDKEEIKDGMDLALCALNKDRNKCYFSGANNPLWLIRSQEKGELIVNGDRIEPNLALEEYPFNLYEIKADPQPIGKYLDRQNFSLSEIDLEEGDTIYIFSDGYADQFGGPKGKKYLSKRFKKQLLSIQNMNIEDQKISINHANEEWMKDEEQLDDICVIGVKV